MRQGPNEDRDLIREHLNTLERYLKDGMKPSLLISQKHG